MKYFAIVASAVTLSGLFTAPPVWADALNLPLHLPEFLLHSSRGYLGVDLGEAKDPHAAEVVMVDHDAPAGKSGLKVHDVILQLDGQPFDSVEQLRHKLHQMPAGRTVTLLISRDGNRLNVTVELCDRKLLQQQAWSKHYSVPQPAAITDPAVKTFLSNPAPRGPGFLGTMIPKALYVGADVNPVRTQLADYFGVKSGTGLLVESVDDQSPASLAGMKAGDVIVKVESEPMTNKSDWIKSVRKHRGQLVQVTVMRNKQEQILSMSAGKPKKN